MSEKPAKSKSKKSATKSKDTTKTKSAKKAKTTAKAPKKAKTTAKAPKKAKTTAKAKKPATQPAKKSKKKRKTQTKAEVKPKSKKSRRLPLEKPVKGVLMNYQRGSVTQRNQYGLIQLEGITSLTQAAPYIGRTVILHFSPQKTNQGRIVSAHGRNGVLRVRFRRSLAADAIAKEVFVY